MSQSDVGQTKACLPPHLFAAVKGPFVTSIVVAMFVILSVAGGTAGVVLLGMEGRGKSRAPLLADRFAKAARHLNGEAEPPAQFTRILNR